MPQGATAEVVAHPDNSKETKANWDRLKSLKRQSEIPTRVFKYGNSHSGPDKHSSPLPPSSCVSVSWPISPRNPWITKNARSPQFHRSIWIHLSELLPFHTFPHDDIMWYQHVPGMYQLFWCAQVSSKSMPGARACALIKAGGCCCTVASGLWRAWEHQLGGKTMHGWHGCSCKQLSFFLSFSPSLFLSFSLSLLLSFSFYFYFSLCFNRIFLINAEVIETWGTPIWRKKQQAVRQSTTNEKYFSLLPWRLVPGSRQVGSQPPFAATQLLTKFQVLPLASATQRPSGHSLQTGINDHCISPTVDSLQAPERLGNSNGILHLQHWSILLTSNAQMRQH